MQSPNRSFDLKNRSGSAKEKTHVSTVFALLIILTFTVYILKLFSMQIIEGKQYRKQSHTISQRIRIIPAQRGEIFDRNATLPMVINNDSFAVDLTLGEIPPGMQDGVCARLAAYLGIKKSEIDAKTAGHKKNSYTAIEIKSNVPFSVISNIAENSFDLPGVSWRSKPIRNYVETGSISHIVGYVGDITKEELKELYNKGYTNTSIIGKTGIEKQYDDLLQGKSGIESHTVDVKGRLVSEKPVITAPISGRDLILTVDTNIQTLAEKALGERVGAVVVLKPANGEILAMVSYPYFDPNIFNTNNAAAYTKLANDAYKPLINRAVNAEYPPASTFKTIMTAALLAEGTVPPEKKIECRGLMDYGDRSFRCHIGVPGHGHMDLKNALAQSCNIYFWTAGRDYLGVERISAYAKEFGLGKSLQIDLPAAKTGFIPNAQWKERRYHEKWLGGDTMSMSIGQGFTVATPLHIANVMAMFVNEGVIYKPHLLKEVRDPVSSEIIKTVRPEILHKSTINTAVWTTMKEYLRYMVTNGSAQGVLMKNKAVDIAGKTGTAEVSGFDKSWHSWFVGYGPYGAPPEDAVVVCVLVEAINPWEWWAPYASTIIFQGIFANQTYDEALDTLRFRYLVKPSGRQE
ncbi:penicillin-binding protein 2 [Treponema sp. OMZ 840]|uniref:penicillin-binding protein 2 n=1 Tax=Treponema sp. OMZ 840 TaxID=244313 RepID=UPI003D90C1A5